MQVNDNKDKMKHNHHSPKYHRETPAPAKETTRYKPGYIQGTKGGYKSVHPN